MFWIKIAIVGFGLSLISHRVIAGEFSFVEDTAGRVFAKYEGDIKPGDSDKILTNIRDNRFVYLWSRGLIVNTRGGDVEEALRIAKLVEKSGWRVDVQKDGVCASSCFLIFASAPARFALGPVVVHRPYFDMSGAGGQDSEAYEQAYRTVITQVRAYLSERLVPDYLIEKMMSKDSSQGYMLTAADLLEIGLVSPAIEEYQIQVCGIPVDRLATKEEINSLTQCRERYMSQARIKFAFGARFKEASEEFDKLNSYMSQLSSQLSPSSMGFQAALRAAQHAVDTLPPEKWLPSVKAAYKPQ